MIGPTLHAMAEPRRREILHLVRDQAHTVGEIAAQFDISRPAISQHLAVLSEAGLVTMSKEGTRRFYRARPEGMAEVQEYIESFWTMHLAGLKDEAERDERAD